MRKNKVLLAFILVIWIIPGVSFATHIVGGELNYRYLGSNDYEIRLTVYRDCYSGVPPFDDPASLGIFNSSNNLVSSVLIPFLGLDTVPAAISTPCLIPPTNVCYEITTYIDTINLPPISGGYQLSYQRCCRNGTINNIINPSNTGATYYATITDQSVVSINSNPVFNQLPPTFICTNAPFIFNHAATDYDGDSLIYEICTPYDGADAFNPMPQPPNNPPYASIVWQPPYSLSNVFGGTPLSINSSTGVLTATPNALGQFVYAVCVKEYRNGVYLGETKREFQVNIVNCPNLIVSAQQSPGILCGSNTSQFINNSYGASTYFWDFGVIPLSDDTSNLFSPQYIYPDTGLYQVMLVAYSGINPSCNDTSYSTVHILPEFTADYTYTGAGCDMTVSFTDASSTINGNVNFWSWDFGDGAVSSLQDPTHTYLNFGTYSVRLISSTADGCVDTVIKNIIINPIPNAEYSNGTSCVSDSIFFTDASTISSGSIISWQWDFGDGNTSGLQNPYHTYALAGTYNVSLVVVSALGCIDTISKIITVNVLPIADFINTTECLNDPTIFTDVSSVSSGNINNWLWDFNDGTYSSMQNPSHVFNSPGIYSVMLTVGSDVGCLDSIAKAVEVYDLPTVDAGEDTSMCFADSTLLNASGSGFTFSWTPTTGLSNPNIFNPWARPDSTTWYTVTTTDGNTCQNVDSVLITIYQLPPANAGPDLWVCPGDSVMISATGGLIYSWTPTLYLSDPNIANPNTSPPNTITYVLLVEDALGCENTDTVEVEVSPIVPTDAGNDIPICFGTSVVIGGNPTAPPNTFYNWYPSATLNAFDIANPTANPLDTTIYIVETTNDTCHGIDSITVMPTPYPEADFVNTIVCFNNPTVFIDSSQISSGSITSWQWDFGDGDSSSLQNPSHIYSTSGNYSVSLISFSAVGCADTTVKMVEVYELPLLGINASNVSCNSYCDGTAQVNASGGTGSYSYLWSSGQTMPVISNLCPGIYYITVTDSNLCSSIDSIAISEPLALTISPSTENEICYGSCNGGATANVSGGTLPYIYSWNDPNSQNTQTAINLCIGIYIVSVLDSNDCLVSDTVIVGYQFGLPNVDASADNYSLFIGQRTALHSTLSTGATYSWVPTLGLDDPLSPNPVATPTATTTYFITVTDTNGCSKTDSVTITVKNILCGEPEIFIPNTFTPDGDNSNDVLYVRGNTIEEVYFAIYNRWGEKVFETTNKSIGWDGSYKGKKVDPGVFVYYLEVKCINEGEFFKKGNITILR